MYRIFNLGTKTIHVQPYNTRLELDVIETNRFSELNEDDCEIIVNEIISKCTNAEPSELSKYEKIAIVFFIRAITIGDELSINYTCPCCGSKNHKIVNLSDVFSEPCKFSDTIKPKFMSNDEYMNVNIESEIDSDMDIEEFENLNLFDYYFIYNEKINLLCSKCNTESHTSIITYKQCVDFFSEETFESLTSWIHILVYSDSHSRSDVLEMTPIERMMEINYFNKQTETEKETN